MTCMVCAVFLNKQSFAFLERWRFGDAEAPGSVPEMLGIRADHSESTAGSSHGSAYVAWSNDA